MLTPNFSMLKSQFLTWFHRLILETDLYNSRVSGHQQKLDMSAELHSLLSVVSLTQSCVVDDST